MGKNEATVFEILVGLNVIDDTRYQAYREGMMPILHSYGGKFGYDFKVSEVLISETENEINRVFTIQFPNETIMEAFFSDTNYIKVKEIYFEGAVEITTIISSYTK
jgi:uncharacterized protein (DUF1330 family)